MRKFRIIFTIQINWIAGVHIEQKRKRNPKKRQNHDENTVFDNADFIQQNI